MKHHVYNYCKNALESIIDKPFEEWTQSDLVNLEKEGFESVKSYFKGYNEYVEANFFYILSCFEDDLLDYQDYERTKTKKDNIIESILLLLDLNYRHFSPEESDNHIFNINRKRRRLTEEELRNEAKLPFSRMNWVATYRDYKSRIKDPNNTDFDIENVLKNALGLLKGSKREYFEIKRAMITLNNTLKEKEKIKVIVGLEQEMKQIEAKKYITVKEFEKKYNLCSTSQQNYRGRMKDPLPYHQRVERGKITYNIDEVERWFQNQYK